MDVGNAWFIGGASQEASIDSGDGAYLIRSINILATQLVLRPYDPLPRFNYRRTRPMNWRSNFSRRRLSKQFSDSLQNQSR